MEHDIVQYKAEVLAFIIIIPYPHQSMLGESGKASDNMTWITIVLGGGDRSYFFS